MALKTERPKRNIAAQTIEHARRLRALSPDDIFAVRAGEKDASGLKLVEPTRIKTLAQPRKSFPEEEMANLRESIHETRVARLGVGGTGILQPLLVRADPEAPAGEASYILVAGERRLRAAQFLKLEQVPALVVEGDERAVRLMQLIENLQRQDLPPLEEAAAIAELKEAQKLSVRDLAQMLGKGKGYVEDRLRLLKMDEDVRSMVSGRPDTLTHAREIQTVKEPKLRKQLIGEAVAGAPVLKIRQQIEKHSGSSQIEVPPKQETRPRQEVQQELQQEEATLPNQEVVQVWASGHVEAKQVEALAEVAADVGFDVELEMTRFEVRLASVELSPEQRQAVREWALRIAERVA